MAYGVHCAVMLRAHVNGVCATGFVAVCRTVLGCGL